MVIEEFEQKVAVTVYSVMLKACKPFNILNKYILFNVVAKDL